MAITQGVSGSSGGGGGGAATLAAGSVSAGAYVLGSILDGAIVTLGALGDAAVGDASGSLNAHTRQIAKLLGAGITLGAGAAVIGAVTQSGTWNVAVNTALPAGANSIGTVVLGAGAAVVGAVTQSGTWNVTVNAALPVGSNTIGAVTGPGAVALATDRTTAAAPFSHQLSDGAAFYVGAKTGQLPAALVNNRVDVNVGKVPGTVSSVNSTTVNLSNGAVFTGTSEDVSGYSSVSVNVFADQSSAAGGLSLQWSSNGTNWDIVNTYTVTLNVGQTVLLPPRAQFFRLVYTNGGVTQTNFRLQTVFHQTQVSQDIGAASTQVQGAAAAGTALTGNPVPMGISDGTNVQTVLQAAGGTGAVITQVGLPATGIALWNSSNSFRMMQNSNSLGDGVGPVGALISVPWVFNGASFDRQRSNVDATLLASASRTTTQGPTTLTTYNLGAIIFVLDMTSVGTGSVTLTISEVDPASGKSILLLSGAAVTTNSTNVYTIDPMLTAAANSIAKARTPRTLSWTVTANNANAATYSLGAMELMP